MEFAYGEVALEVDSEGGLGLEEVFFGEIGQDDLPHEPLVGLEEGVVFWEVIEDFVPVGGLVGFLADDFGVTLEEVEGLPEDIFDDGAEGIFVGTVFVLHLFLGWERFPIFGLEYACICLSEPLTQGEYMNDSETTLSFSRIFATRALIAQAGECLEGKGMVADPHACYLILEDALDMLKKAGYGRKLPELGPCPVKPPEIAVLRG